MNWTKLANALSAYDRIECDMVSAKGANALQVVTSSLAMTIIGLPDNNIPEQLEAIVRSCNLGNATKIMEKHGSAKRPYLLSKLPVLFNPGEENHACYIFKGIHEEDSRETSPRTKSYFIRKHIFDMIPGDVTVMSAPTELGSIQFISTQAYGYIMPYVPTDIEKANIRDAATLLTRRL